MEPILNNEIRELMDLQAPFCVSIYIPAHHTGKPVLEMADAGLFKEQLKSVRLALQKRGLNEKETAILLQPAESLLADKAFWRYQEKGLAVFLSGNFFRTLRLPVRFAPFNYLSHSFYLLPLLPLINAAKEFYLLSLDLEEVRLYRCSAFSIVELDTKELMPSGLEEVVGADFQQKSLQFRSLQKGQGQTVFHGHGEGKDEHKEEVTRYLRAVDKGLTTLVRSENLPVVVAGVDYLFPLFREVTASRNIWPQSIHGPHRDSDSSSLHAQAVEMLGTYLKGDLQVKSDLYCQFMGTGRASNNIDDIIPAAVHGRVDTLFVAEGTDSYGIYDDTRGKVEFDEMMREDNVSLFNLAAVQTADQGGAVYVLPKEEIPDGFSTINALFRY